jgi:hypothetical protein
MPGTGNATLRSNNDNFQTATSSSVYTPDTDITSIRINVSVESTPAIEWDGANITFYLSADGGTNWEVIPKHNMVYNHTFSNTGRDLRWKAVLFTEDDKSSPNITSIDFPDEIGSTYPSNIYIDIGNDGIIEYNMTGNLNTTLSLNLTNESVSSITSYLNSPNEAGILLLPVIFYSDTRGVIISNINFSITGVNNINIEDVNITCTTSSCNVPINVSSSGNVNVSNLALSYLGHKNVTITAHDSSSLVTDSSIVRLYYSGWGYRLASDYLEFIPRRYNSKNVSAFGQNDNTPIFNITSQNYDRNMNLSIYINEQEENNCVNLSYNTNRNKSSATMINAGFWYDIFNNKQAGYNQGVWLWADYDCAGLSWGYYEPDISIRGCVIDGICDTETS